MSNNLRIKVRFSVKIYVGGKGNDTIGGVRECIGFVRSDGESEFGTYEKAKKVFSGFEGVGDLSIVKEVTIIQDDFIGEDLIDCVKAMNGTEIINI